MDIQWGSFAVVAAVVLVSTVLLTVLYSTGVRLLETTPRGAVVQRSAAYACFALCALAVLFGLWLVIPQFHAS